MGATFIPITRNFRRNEISVFKKTIKIVEGAELKLESF